MIGLFVRPEIEGLLIAVGVSAAIVWGLCYVATELIVRWKR